jgi:hypothetical protein
MREPFGQLSPQGDFMKKRALAILLVLVMVTGGLFATYTVAVPGAATATLNATIGDYLDHGFNYNGLKYQPSIIIDDAFGTTAPSFRYGFRTNAQGKFVFKMVVGNFINKTTVGTVKIASVTSDQGDLTYTPSGYTIFTDESADGPTTYERKGEVKITIYPAKEIADFDHTGLTDISVNEQVGGDVTAPAGAYESIITFTISAS